MVGGYALNLFHLIKLYLLNGFTLHHQQQQQWREQKKVSFNSRWVFFIVSHVDGWYCFRCCCCCYPRRRGQTNCIVSRNWARLIKATASNSHKKMALWQRVEQVNEKYASSNHNGEKMDSADVDMDGSPNAKIIWWFIWKLCARHTAVMNGKSSCLSSHYFAIVRALSRSHSRTSSTNHWLYSL